MIHYEILPQEQKEIYKNLSFFGDIDFVIKENSLILDDVLEVANLKSLLATKLKATFDRAEYNDYIDIVEILKTGQITIEEGINKMFDFFGTDFTRRKFLKI